MPPPPPTWRNVLAPAVLGAVASVLIVGAATFPGQWFPASRQGSWFFTFPVLGSPTLSHWAAFGVYYGSMTLLGVAWMWLLRVVAQVGCRTAVVLAVFALWATPLAVGPPVGSDDAIAYAATGKLVAEGFDPYEVGIIALGEVDPAVQAASPTWRDAPQPYGPLYLRSVELAHKWAGSSFRATVMVLRFANLALLALLAIPLSSLARRYGSRPPVVLAATLSSPLVLVHLVGGVHNEAFMLLPLVTGVAVGAAGLRSSAEPAGLRDSVVGTRFAGARWGLLLVGVVLCGVAATIKVPAIIGAAVLGWLAAPRSDLRRQLAASAVATAVAAAVVVVIGVVSGLGLGWMDNLGVPQRVYTILSPFDAVGVLVMNGLSYLGWSVGVLDGFRTAGLVVALAVTAACVVRADRLGLPMALGAALLALAFMSPVVWVWYLSWGLVFVALRGLPVWLQLAVVILNLSVTPLGPGTLDVNGHPTRSALLLVVIVTVMAVVALRPTWARRQASSGGAAIVVDAPR